jgi:hypothetical protein
VKCWQKEVPSDDNILPKSEELIVLNDCLLTPQAGIWSMYRQAGEINY